MMITKRQRISDLLAEGGLSNTQIARRVGASEAYVSIVKNRSPEQIRESVRAQYYERHGGAPWGSPEHIAKIKGRYPEHDTDTRQQVISAVDSGLSYSQAAEQLGLKSRGVVAGILHRRPESRA